MKCDAEQSILSPRIDAMPQTPITPTMTNPMVKYSFELAPLLTLVLLRLNKRIISHNVEHFAKHSDAI
jgi:hypothetical protein